jgi:hypothetical protein
MPAMTLVMEAAGHRQLLRIDGYMPLPVGSRIQLGKLGDPEPPSDAEVIGIRVWGAAPPGTSATLVLDVVLLSPDEHTDRP